MAPPQSAHVLWRWWRRGAEPDPQTPRDARPAHARCTGHPGRAHGALASLAAALLLASTLLAGCSTYKGPLTYLDSVDVFAVGNWSAVPAQNQVGVGNGIYPMPSKHLILIHIYIPASITSLGPGALHGAVGVWWLALDDRVPGDSVPQWLPGCDRFKTGAKGAAFDLAGTYLYGPASASLSRYPLSINPEDSSISVALSPADEISMPRTGGVSAAPLAPSTGTCLP